MNAKNRHKTVQALSVLVVMLFVLNAVTGAQDPVFEFQAPSDTVFYPVANPESVNFVASIEMQQTGPAGEDPIQVAGFSMIMSHDEALLSINEVTTPLLSPEGVAPQFDEGTIFPNGMSHGIVFSLSFAWTLSFPVATPALDIHYQMLSGPLTGATSSTSAALNFEDNLNGDPGTNVVSSAGGISYAAVTVDSALTLTPYEGSQFIRGDVDQNGSLDLADGIGVLQFLFLNTATTCYSSLDADDTGNVSISDAVRVLCAVFCPGAPAPAGPYPGCGVDSTDDDGTCEEYSGCP